MKERQSNFELLRLVSIFFITMHHLIIHGSNACGYLEPYSFNQGIMGIFLNSFFIIGVNCFILISGWFGIRRPIKSIVHLLFVFVVLATLMNFIRYFIHGGWGSLDMFQSYNIRSWWFLADYIILALLAPFIENSIKIMDYRRYSAFIIVTTIINIFFCHELKIENANGYSLLNFIYLYYLARYIRINVESQGFFDKSPLFYGLLYLCASLMLAGVFFLLNMFKLNMESIHYFAYNNPIIIITSVSCFMSLAIAKPFCSKAVNLFAGGVFAAYIIQSSVQLCGYRVLASKMIFDSYSYMGLFVFGIIIVIGGTFAGMTLEYVWKKIEEKFTTQLDRLNGIY